jgi:hypothetical protein
MLLKDQAVQHDGLTVEMYFALGVADALKKQMFGKDLVVTSLLDGTHNPGSLHPLGKAADLRTLDLTVDERIRWHTVLKAALSPMGFDVVWEGGVGATPATTGAHIHVEYDPKGRTFWRYA